MDSEGGVIAERRLEEIADLKNSKSRMQILQKAELLRRESRLGRLMSPTVLDLRKLGACLIEANPCNRKVVLAQTINQQIFKRLLKFLRHNVLVVGVHYGGISTIMKSIIQGNLT